MGSSKNKASPLCKALSIRGAQDVSKLTGVTAAFKKAAKQSPQGKIVRWGIPFSVKKVHVLNNKVSSFSLPKVKTKWLCFLHTADNFPAAGDSIADKRQAGLQGEGHLKELAATYVIKYTDGTEAPFEIRYRYQINIANPGWGENPFMAVPEHTQRSYRNDENIAWGQSQTGATNNDRQWGGGALANWICAWENPFPKKSISGIQLRPGNGTVMLLGVSTCETDATPLRWLSRKKVLINVKNSKVDAHSMQAAYMHLSDDRSQLLDIDMGTVISVVPHFAYDKKDWKKTSSFKHRQEQSGEFIVEYAAHPQAKLYTKDGGVIDLSVLQRKGKVKNIKVIAPAEQRVRIKVIDKKHKRPVAVRLHIHGQSDEYLAPMDRHRIPNSNWFEDYAPEFLEWGMHTSTYIDGETQIKLPLGKIYIEVSKGFECTPVHKIVSVNGKTDEIIIEVEKTLDWREKGWVTADTHVHFLSPTTANLEGAAEGVHVVNLLASQWGELMTNAGDFDGKSTFSVTESGEDYLVRVGTENRQHVMGHISLCGYNGSIIAPMCCGGADEGAIGDPVDILLTEWAKKCQDQDGIVVIPHSPNPRAEHAAAVVSGFVDAMEIPSFDVAITPYQLVHWYRYLNCGMQVPLTGGTDKMMADMEIGRIRVYSKIKKSEKLNYDVWKKSMRSGNTFVTFGPLLEFEVDGHEPGQRFTMKKSGGSVTATWNVESVKYEVTSVELLVNGEIVENKRIKNNKGQGYFNVNIERSSWLCLLVRAKRADGEEKILAHSSAVMIDVKGTEFFAAADAISILDQIEGSMAYLDNIGTKADVKRYKEMRLMLEKAHKIIHARLHQAGHDHQHAPGGTHHKH